MKAKASRFKAGQVAKSIPNVGWTNHKGGYLTTMKYNKDVTFLLITFPEGAQYCVNAQWVVKGSAMYRSEWVGNLGQLRGVIMDGLLYALQEGYPGPDSDFLDPESEE